jgi:hypothetical protein
VESNMTLIRFLAFPKSKWCGWDSLPPGFQFPVKELVASLVKPKEELHKLLFFSIIIER